MEILYENLLNCIREQCSPGWDLGVFKGHIIVNLPTTEKDFREVYHQIKREITFCVEKHFPDRESDTLFEVRNGSWNCSFKIGKTVMSGVSQS